MTASGPCPTVESTIQALFGDGAAIASKSAVLGGCINTASELVLKDGTRLFMKENHAGFKEMFAKEATGLEALQTEGGPTVPKPLAVRSGADRQFILMEYIESGRPGPAYWEEFGRAFATMHAATRGKAYGFDEDNFIGSTVQENPWCSSWIEFFGEHRLGFQIRLAKDRGLASVELVRQTERLIDRLPDFLPEPDHPSVLHGDLWGGNAMADAHGNPVIFDPAAYFGHNEADLAMTELFGRFDARFYGAYSEVIPLTREYRTRKEIYGLYHLLNHLNLFGASYASSALSVLGRLL